MYKIIICCVLQTIYSAIICIVRYFYISSSTNISKKYIPTFLDLQPLVDTFHYNNEDINLIDVIYSMVKNAKKRLYISTSYICLENDCINGNIWNLMNYINEKALNIDVYMFYDIVPTYITTSERTPIKKLFQNIKFTEYGYLFPTSDYCNYHKKVIISDDYIIYSGQNFDNEYLLNASYFIESFFITKNAMISNIEVNILNKQYRDGNWSFINEEPSMKNIIMKENDSYWIKEIQCKQLYNKSAIILLKNKFENAKKSIIITTNYFLPSYEILEIFENALKRGVEITMVSNRIGTKNNNALYPYYVGLLISKYKNFTSYIIKNKEFFSHSKLMIIDSEEIILSSFNITYKSIHFDYENWIIICPSAKLLENFTQFITFLKTKSSDNIIDTSYITKIKNDIMTYLV
jgi:cardiolipin synthase